jgi:hypothetical protein
MAVYREEGCTWKVEILRKYAKEDGIGYDLRLLEIIEQNPMFVAPPVNSEFEIWTSNAADGYCSWHLSER